MSLANSAPKKTTETRFATNVKIVVSEVEFRALHSNNWTNLAYAAYLQDNGTRDIFSENFSSIRSVLSSPFDDNNNNNNNKMKQKCLPV